MSEATSAEPKPGIVILGTPRSGTTLVRRILDAHSNIACPPETYLLSGAARFLHEESFAAGLRIGVTSGLGFAGFDEDEVLGRLRTMVLSFFEDHARSQGKGRWAEKTAFDVFHLAGIRRVLQGHAKFVCVQRHGLDVAASIADLVDKTGGYVQELHDYLRLFPQPLEAFAHAWVDTANAVADLCESDDDAMSMRYEDFVADPAAMMQHICEFVGEPWEDGLVERALSDTGRVGFGDWKTYARAQVDASSVGRWKKLPPPTRFMLADICNPTLERLGYETINVPAAARDQDPVAARKRYELGLLVNRMKAEKKTED